MSASIRWAFAAAGLLFFAGSALAQLPPYPCSDADGDLMLGNARGLAILPAPLVKPTVFDGYQVIVRDFYCNPLAGAVVTILFTGSGIRPHATQSGGQVADCDRLTISKISDANGVVVFLPATVGLASTFVPDVQVRAEGILLTTVRFRSVDLVPAVSGTASAVDLADLNEFRLRFLGIFPYTVQDPSCDFATEGYSAGVVNGADLNVFRMEFLCGAGGPVPPPCQQTQCP